jgi:hypothetical protein
MGITGKEAVVGRGLGAYAGNRAEREAIARGVEQSKNFDLAAARARQVANAHQGKKDDDAASDRKKVDSSLVESMAKQVVNGKANIDVDVSGAVAKANGGGDRDLFNKTRSKTAAQMPNTPANTDGDKSSTANEEE